MDVSELFWNASPDELKRGYIQEERHYTCLICGTHIEKGIIYPHESVLYEAERYMRLHIEETHGSVFSYLIGLDKKMTGLTDHQNQLLRLFYQGKSDKEVQTEMEIGSVSTIRHHRFALREKERQAKLFLTIMELLQERDKHAPAFIPLHKTATMIDSRYDVTKEEQEHILQKYWPDRNRFTLFPPKEKQRLIILREIVRRFKAGKMYTEAEINDILQAVHTDYVMVRRYLIEYGFISRKADGSEYWLTS